MYAEHRHRLRYGTVRCCAGSPQPLLFGWRRTGIVVSGLGGMTDQDQWRRRRQAQTGRPRSHTPSIHRKLILSLSGCDAVTNVTPHSAFNSVCVKTTLPPQEEKPGNYSQLVGLTTVRLRSV